LAARVLAANMTNLSLESSGYRMKYGHSREGSFGDGEVCLWRIKMMGIVNMTKIISNFQKYKLTPLLACQQASWVVVIR
jgi:hypothetical protein